MATTLESYKDAPEHTGVLQFQTRSDWTCPTEDQWYMLTIDRDFLTPLVEEAKNEGLEFKPTGRPHISVMKGETPSKNQDDWGKFDGEEVAFKYNKTFHHENGFHLWINCYSERLCQLREHFGLPTLRRREDDVYLVNFHMTLGKLLNPVEPNLRPQYRLCPQSHIDVQTGMQHL